jgi:hypothetical protein
VHHNVVDQSVVVMDAIITYAGVIRVDWINGYDTLGNTRTVHVAGNTMKLGTQITNIFGSYDIVDVLTTVTIYDSAGVTQVATTAMNQPTALIFRCGNVLILLIPCRQLVRLESGRRL